MCNCVPSTNKRQKAAIFGQVFLAKERAIGAFMDIICFQNLPKRFTVIDQNSAV
jgi:hypothetical protein